jgi:hypothetical protein
MSMADPAGEWPAPQSLQGRGQDRPALTPGALIAMGLTYNTLTSPARQRQHRPDPETDLGAASTDAMVNR